jgi:hypothetical protein
MRAMSRQLCEVCQRPPPGTDEQQAYSIGVPDKKQRGIRIEVPLCMICMIWVCEAVVNVTRPGGSSWQPIHQALESVKKSFVHE